MAARIASMKHVIRIKADIVSEDDSEDEASNNLFEAWVDRRNHYQ